MAHPRLILNHWQGEFKHSSSRNLTGATKSSMVLGTLNATNQINAIF